MIRTDDRQTDRQTDGRTNDSGAGLQALNATAVHFVCPSVRHTRELCQKAEPIEFGMEAIPSPYTLGYKGVRASLQIMTIRTAGQKQRNRAGIKPDAILLPLIVGLCVYYIFIKIQATASSKKGVFYSLQAYGKYTRGQRNLTKRASRGAHSPVRGHPRGSKVVPLNS